MILCDIGNSTFHFLVDEDECKIGIDGDLDSEILKSSDEVYFISVNDVATKTFKKRFPSAIDLKEKIDFQTSYASTLGIDRIVACKLFDDGIIVDFGSAITVDIMENKKHLGGFIMPGFDSLKMVYPQISSKLQFEFKTNLNFDRLPQDTDVAISFGIIKMVVEPIEELQRRYNKKLIITGETAKVFLPYFKNYEFNERLIFTSMKKIIEEKI